MTNKDSNKSETIRACRHALLKHKRGCHFVPFSQQLKYKKVKLTKRGKNHTAATASMCTQKLPMTMIACLMLFGLLDFWDDAGICFFQFEAHTMVHLEM